MSNNLRFDIEHLKSAIDALLVNYPELQDDEILRTDMLEAETDLNEILRAIINRVQEAEAFKEVLTLRIQEFGSRKARYERGIDGLRSLAQSLMERANLNKAVLPEATLSVSYRKGSPFVADETLLPDECVKLVKKPDMATIKQWCEAGNVPDGVALSNGKSVLTIRTK